MGPTFTTRWLDGLTRPWIEHVIPRLSQIPRASWLEVGSYEGQSALWTLDHVLSRGSTITCVDFFDDNLPGLETWGKKGYSDRFDANLAGRPVRKIAGWSPQVLRDLFDQGERFHGAYVDGGHDEEIVARDLELVWPMLLQEAVMVCDDYGSPSGVKPAADNFLAKNRHEILHVGYQIIVAKQE